MLDFYGIQIANLKTGELQRSAGWKSRYRNLNTSFHNNLRITRILKSLGELGFEHFKLPFCVFIWKEIDDGFLSNCRRSALNFWFLVLRSVDERANLYKLVHGKDPKLSEIDHHVNDGVEEKKKEIKTFLHFRPVCRLPFKCSIFLHGHSSIGPVTIFKITVVSATVVFCCTSDIT